ncbi:MAG: hypothetical protein MZV64_11050 [Ignavibacteriales bacterium]|nr:hypothetical protein [Ignavibacteriales bacterium]
MPHPRTPFPGIQEPAEAVVGRLPVRTDRTLAGDADRGERRRHLRLSEQDVPAERLVPERQVIEGGIDAAVPESRRGRALVGEAPPAAVFRIAEGAVGDRVPAADESRRAGHPQGLEDALAEEGRKSPARDLLDDEAEHDVARIAVAPERPRREPAGRLLFQELEDAGVVDLRRLDGNGRDGRGHEVFVVGQARSVLEEVADGDGAAVIREAG